VSSIILVGAKADLPEFIINDIKFFSEEAYGYALTFDIPHMLVSSRESLNMDILRTWIDDAVAKVYREHLEEQRNNNTIFRSEPLDLELMSMDASYRPDRGRTVLDLDDSCCDSS